jgi:hypothetical protein
MFFHLPLDEREGQSPGVLEGCPWRVFGTFYVMSKSGGQAFAEKD